MKKPIHITLPHSVVTYEAETLLLRKSDKRKLLVLERKILSKSFGPVKGTLSSEWRIRRNNKKETHF